MLPPPAPTAQDILENEGSLTEVLNAAVAEMRWITASDAAMIKLAQEQATAIDAAIHAYAELSELYPPLESLERDGVDISAIVKRIAALEKLTESIKVIGWIGPHLANTLRDLGGAPGQRKGLEADAPIKSKLNQLRDASKTRTNRASTAK